MTSRSGIRILMDDLGEALNSGKQYKMLGGGAPAQIPEMIELFRQSAEMFAKGSSFGLSVSSYDSSEGCLQFRKAVAKLLNKRFGWDIDAGNVALTNGSQNAFFILFNLYAGQFTGGIKKKILLPIVPEYIGYCDVGLLPEDEFFVSAKPKIELIDELLFKYHIDFDNLVVDDNIGAICVSRPTNPTGNVLSDDEIERLSDLAKNNGVPLIIDNAYGMPFPNIIYNNATPFRNDNTILCMSLSKLGMPSLRTGIIIASKEVVKEVGMVNAILNLAPTALGPAMMTGMIESGQVLDAAERIVCPYYLSKRNRTVEMIRDLSKGQKIRLHKPEGAFFMWLWFEDLKISSNELYEKLKGKGVLIVPGCYFFPGFAEEFEHKQKCIRISYAGSEKDILEGLKIIFDTVSENS